MRGLTHTKQFPTDKENCGFQANPFSPSPSLSMYPGPGRTFSTPVEKETLPLSPYSPIPPSNFESPFKMSTSLPHMSHITFTENPPHPDQRQREHDRDKDRGSPIPRRKQVRARNPTFRRDFRALTHPLFPGETDEKIRRTTGWPSRS